MKCPNTGGASAMYDSGLIVLVCSVHLETQLISVQAMNVKPGYRIILVKLLSHLVAHDKLYVTVTQESDDQLSFFTLQRVFVLSSKHCPSLDRRGGLY